jgi:hypothetical protein
MKARMFQRLALITGLIVVAGCGMRQPAAKEVCSPSAPAQPFVFYDPTGNPSERTPVLSEPELQEITAWVAARAPRTIWFIRVTPSLRRGKRERVYAYLSPDKVTARIRVGLVQTVFYEGMLAEYIQVSPADQPFTGQLTKPSAIDLPFTEKAVAIDPNSRQSSPMSREELVGIVDFVRDLSNYQNTGLGRRPELPIFSIRREGSKVEVTFGYLYGPLAGGGETVTLERTPTGYRVKTVGMWAS